MFKRSFPSVLRFTLMALKPSYFGFQDSKGLNAFQINSREHGIKRQNVAYDFSKHSSSTNQCQERSMLLLLFKTPANFKMSLISWLFPVEVLRSCLPPFLHSGVSSPSQDTLPCTQDRLTAENKSPDQKCG